MSNRPVQIKKDPASSRGFTLLELLVTIIIGVFISLAATTFLEQTARSYNYQDMTARIQENARFAVQMMSYDLRQAGFYGCARVAPYEDYAPIVGVDNGANGESDTLTVRYANSSLGVFDVAGDKVDAVTGDIAADTVSEGTTDLKLVTAGSASEVDAESIFYQGDEILVSDCAQSEVVTVASATNSKITLERPLEKTFRTVVQVRLMSDFTYSITPGTENSPPSLTRTLTPRNGTPDPEPLVEGVDFMRVLYGIDTSGNGAPDRYTPWTTSLANADQIVTMKVGLLVRSVSNNRTSRDGQYGGAFDQPDLEVLDLPIGDITLPADDRVSRRTFVNTLQVRNL